MINKRFIFGKKEREGEKSFPRSFFSRPFFSFCDVFVLCRSKTHQERQGLVRSGADGLVDGGLDLLFKTKGCDFVSVKEE